MARVPDMTPVDIKLTVSNKLVAHLGDLVALEGFGETIEEVVERFAWHCVHEQIVRGLISEEPVNWPIVFGAESAA